MKVKSVFTSVMLLVLVLVTALFWYRYHTNIAQYNLLQYTLMQKQAEIGARGIDESLSQIRSKMSAISVDEMWLSNLESFQNDEDVQLALANRFKLFFPKMHSYVLTDKIGHRLGGDLDFLIGDVCQSDIINMATMFNPRVNYFDYRPYIHPVPDQYHFDMMMPIFAKQKEMIFFMSFSADLLHYRLREQMISEHPMYLLRDDVEGLIEVAYNGVRDKLKRSNRLSSEELSSVSASYLVPYSMWRVVVVPNQALLDKYANGEFKKNLVIFILLMFFWVAVFWLGLRQETARAQVVSRLSHISMHDELTGLANRRQLIDSLKHLISDAQNQGQLSAIIFLDLNDFKEINDIYGHKVGDALLVECSKRLEKLIRAEDVASRLGGDEFVVLLKHLGRDEARAKKIVAETIKRLKQELDTGYVLDGIKIRSLPSIGWHLISAEDNKVEEVIRKADESMYQDKRDTKKSPDINKKES